MLWRYPPNGVEARAVADEPADHGFANVLPTEPHGRALRPPGFWLKVNVVEGEELPGVADGRALPHQPQNLQLLVEDAPAAVEVNAQGGVLISMPGDGRLDDKTPLGEQVECGQIVGENERMPQRCDERNGSDPDARRRLRNRRQQHKIRWPRRHRSLVTRHRVVAGISHPARGAGRRTEEHVVAHHGHVESGVLSLLSHAHDTAHIPRIGHGPVLGEHRDQPWYRHQNGCQRPATSRPLEKVAPTSRVSCCCTIAPY